MVSKSLERWEQKAHTIPDPHLRAQALSSIASKRFHCQGGASYAVPCGNLTGEVIEAIVAVQTISDYLDNLCDRAGVYDESSFRQLHLAMSEALEPRGHHSDYYALYPRKDDGGYLEALVRSAREHIATLPSHQVVTGPNLAFAALYTDLQSLKHREVRTRIPGLIGWYGDKGSDFPEVRWWEFAAASGSTLGIFALLASACRPGLTKAQVQQTVKAYFPYICGLHILLDYLIDLEEDRKEGDLNLVAMYPSERETRERLCLFVRESLEMASLLPEAGFHKTIVRGLLAMYLSDPKVRAQDLTPVAQDLILQAGWGTRFMARGCQALRAMKVL